MRLKTSLIFAGVAAITLIVFHNSSQVNKWYAYVENDYSAEIYSSAVERIQDDVRLLYKKLESEKQIIATTTDSLNNILDVVEKQTRTLEETANNTLRDFADEVSRLSDQIDEKYQRYHEQFNGISISNAKYKSVYELMEITINNNRKQLNDTRNEMKSRLEKWSRFDKLLRDILVEVNKLKADYNRDAVEKAINDINSMIQIVETDVADKVEDITEYMKVQVVNRDEDGDVEGFLNDIVTISVKKLRKLFHDVERSMLRIHLDLQGVMGAQRYECLEIIEANFNEFHVVKLRIIEFIEDIENSINDKRNLIEDVGKQIDNFSRLRVKLITEKGEQPLEYEDRVPYFGIMPNETLASYNQEDKKFVMTNYGIRSDGSQFIREIAKEEINDKVYIKEIFYDEEGQVVSDKSYVFTYVA